MVKRTNNFYHDNTTINKKILTKMLFKIPKEIFPTEKYSFSKVTFFFAVQEAYRMTVLNFPHPPFSSACKALWGDDVIRLLAMTAWRQF